MEPYPPITARRSADVWRSAAEREWDGIVRVLRRSIAGAAVAAAMLLAACGSDTDDTTGDDPANDEFTDDEFEDDDFADDDSIDDGSEDGAAEDDEVAAGGGAAPDGSVDESLARDDIDCDEDGLGSTDELPFTVGHYVVDGSLGAVCFGTASDTLTDSWGVLAAITPPSQLTDLGLFGGFTSGEAGDEVTLAFVNALDDDGSVFQMSVNVETAADDPNELALTMAHEFSHVFTSTETQLDRTDEAIDSCGTYYNGEGCYTDGALMWAWIQTFWDGGLIDQIDPEAEATAADGEQRCDADPSFFGAYAASSPEEDFAESFSVFVFRVEPATPEQQAKVEWMGAQPGLAEFRDRATTAGLGPLSNNFEACGTAA